jgi:hypothetical protein
MPTMTYATASFRFYIANPTEMDRCGLIYQNRWADIQFDGTLQAVDEGIEFMTQLTARAANSRVADVVEETLDDLEAAAFATALQLRRCLTLDAARPVHMSYEVACVLHTAVSQYSLYLPQDISMAILNGVALATTCRVGITPRNRLTDLERGYVEWVIPLLTRHLVCEPCDDERARDIN